MPIVAAAGIAALEILILGFMALILTYALVTFVQAVAYPIGWLVDNFGGWLGISGNDVRNAANTLANATQNALSSAWSAATQPVLTAFHVIGNNMRVIPYAQQWVLTNIVNALGYIAHEALGTNNGQLSTYVVQGLQSVGSWAYGQLDTLYNTLVGYTQESFTTLGNWTAQQIATAEQYTTQVSQYVQTEAVALSGEIASEAVKSTAYAQKLYQQSTQYAQSIVTTAENDLYGDIVKVDRDLSTTIVQTQQWTQGLVSHEADLRAAGVAGVLALATTVIIPRVETLERAKEECGDPLCEGLLDFAKAFQGIAGLLEAGGLLAFLIEASMHPKQYAQPIVSFIDGVGDAATNTFDAFAGTHF